MSFTPKQLARYVFSVTAGALLVFASANLARADLSGSLTADNAFFAYVSPNNSVLGTLVAQGNSWPTTFTFSGIALTPGVTSYLQIEAINYGGPAGFIGEFTLSTTNSQFANGTQDLVTGTTYWTGSYNDSNSNPSAPQPWVTPTGGVASFGANGVGPWGGKTGISSAADWIWPGDANSLPGGGACGYCTVDLSTPIYTAATPEPETTPALLGAAIAALIFVRRALQKRHAKDPLAA